MIIIIIITIRMMIMIIISIIMISITGISSSMPNNIISITILHHHLLSLGQQKGHSDRYLRAQRWGKDDCTEGKYCYAIVHIITKPTSIIFSYLLHHHHYHHLCNLTSVIINIISIIHVLKISS